MIKLTKLNSNILTFEGLKIASMTNKEESVTYKSSLISICELHQTKEPGTGESLKVFDIGIKIQNAGDELELEEADAIFLKGIVDKSHLFVTVVVGRLIHYLDEALPKVEEKKEQI